MPSKSKVNIKFVVGLIAAAVAVLALVVYIGARTVTKSGADHIAAGDVFAAQGDWEKAAGSYSKAVNKDKKLAYIQKWVEALEHITPATSQEYQDRFQKEYMPALSALAAIQPTDAQAQMRPLDLTLFRFRLVGAQPTDWEFFVRQTDDVLREFPPSDPGAQVLRRYRGIARTNWAEQVGTAPDDALTKAKEDLEAAISADPADARAMAALGDWYRVASQRARLRRETQAADEMLAEAQRRMEAFVASNRVCLPVIWSLTQMQMASEAAAAQDVPLREALRRHHAKITRLFDQAKSEPAGQLDRMLCYQIGAMALGASYPEAMTEIDALITHAFSAAPNDVYLLFNYAELQMTGRRYTEAFATLDRLVKMPNLPMSVEGMLLFGLRQEALARQGSCVLAEALMARRTAEVAARDLADEAARAEAIKKAAEGFNASMARVKQIRDTLATQYGRPLQLTLLDARIRYFENDLIEARRLLTTYTDQRPNDLSALKLLADVLIRQQQGGAARLQLERVVRLNPTDIEALATLGLTLESLGELREAASVYEKALTIDPGNAELIDRIGKLRSIDARASSDDPVIRTLSLAQEKVTASPPDVPGALAMVKQVYADEAKAGRMDRPRALAIANALLLLEDREGAREVLKDKSLPADDPAKRQLETLLSNPDPVAARLAVIDQSGVNDLYKALFRYQVYRRNDRREPAMAELEKARAIDPEHGLVISALFDESLADGKLDAAKSLAEKASANNIDRVGGAVFRIRIEQAEGRLANAAAMAQQVIDGDPLNAMGHRLLGALRLQMSQPVEALAAFERAIQINPTDPENIKGKLRAMIQGRKLGEALLYARDRRSVAAGDAEFSQILLALEAESGSIEYALDRYARQYARDPGDRDNALEYANLLNKTRRWAEARPVIDRLKSEKFDSQAMVLSANWHANQGDLPKAKAEWETYIAALPSAERTAVLFIQYSEFLAGFRDAAGARQVLMDHRALQSATHAEIDRQLGDVCMGMGDWACAIDAYSKALATVTKDENNLLRYRIIEATLKLGDKDPAKFNDVIRLCDEATAKGVPDDLQLVLLRAEATRGLKSFVEARRFYDRAVSIAPNTPLGFFKRAEFITSELVRAQRENSGPLPSDQVQRALRDAQDDLETAIRFDSTFAAARRLLAMVKRNQQDPDGAAKLLAEGIAIDPNNGVLRGDLVGIYAAQGKLAEALALIDEGIKRSQSPEWHIMGGDLLRAQAQAARASEYYGTAWDKGFRSPQLARVYTDTLLALPRPDFAKVLSILNDERIPLAQWSALLTQRAKVLRLQGKAAESDADIRAAFGTLDQANASAVSVFFQDAGEMFAGKTPAMIGMLEALRPAEGFTPQFRVQMVRFKLGEPTLRSSGLADLDELTAMKDINIAALYQAMRALADLMYAQAAYQSAADVYQRVMVIKPDDYDAMNNYAYTLCKHLRRCEEALPLAQKAVEMIPESPNVKDSLGVILLELGRVGEAESTLLAAKELAKIPAQQVPLDIHLAQVALAKGDRIRAQGLLQAAQREMLRDPRLQAQFQPEYDEVKKKVDGGR